MSSNPFDKYKQTQVLTASREKVLLLMYSGAIKFLNQAIEAGESKNTAERALLIGKTQNIVSELRSTLNFEASFEIASELERLYDFITERLIKANQDLSPQPLKDSLKILITLNEAWEQAIASLQKEQLAQSGG